MCDIVDARTRFLECGSRLEPLRPGWCRALPHECESTGAHGDTACSVTVGSSLVLSPWLRLCVQRFGQDDCHVPAFQFVGSPDVFDGDCIDQRVEDEPSEGRSAVVDRFRGRRSEVHAQTIARVDIERTGENAQGISMVEERTGGFVDCENEIGQIVRRKTAMGGDSPHISPQHTELLRGSRNGQHSR